MEGRRRSNAVLGICRYELDKGLLGQWATEDSSYELCASGVNYTASLGFFLFKVIAITGPSAGSIELSSQVRIHLGTGLHPHAATRRLGAESCAFAGRMSWSPWTGARP